MKNLLKACLCGCLCLSIVPAEPAQKAACCESTCEMASAEDVKKKKKKKKKKGAKGKKKKKGFFSKAFGSKQKYNRIYTEAYNFIIYKVCAFE